MWSPWQPRSGPGLLINCHICYAPGPYKPHLFYLCQSWGTQTPTYMHSNTCGVMALKGNPSVSIPSIYFHTFCIEILDFCKPGLGYIEKRGSRACLVEVCRHSRSHSLTCYRYPFSYKSRLFIKYWAPSWIHCHIRNRITKSVAYSAMIIQLCILIGRSADRADFGRQTPVIYVHIKNVN